MPVDVLRVLVDPCFKNALELGVTLWRSEQVDVLVAPRNIHFNLPNQFSMWLALDEISYRIYVLVSFKEFHEILDENELMDTLPVGQLNEVDPFQ